MIPAIIIDDERHNRNVLKTLVHKYCSSVKIIDESDTCEEAFDKITSLKPQLVFLDIKLPGKSGFDLLRMFQKINFEVIFVSAYDEYAINAFEFNALDYILKPIDYLKLTRAVEKAVAKINHIPGNDNMLYFIKTLDEKNDLINKLSLHHNDKVVLVNVPEISFIEAKKDFCEINLLSGQKYMSSKDLKLFSNVLEQTNQFVRINKSVLINILSIKSYSKGEPCIVELKTNNSFEISRRKKSEVLSRLKSKTQN